MSQEGQQIIQVPESFDASSPKQESLHSESPEVISKNQDQDQTQTPPGKQILTTSSDSPQDYLANQAQTQNTERPPQRRMTLQLKLNQQNDELLDLLEDELVVLQTIKQKLDKSIEKEDKIKYDIYLAEYCSIIQRSTQSLRILTQRKINSQSIQQLNGQQTERLNNFCKQFNKDFKEYYQTWSQQMKNDFNSFMEESSPRRYEKFHLSEEINQIENYSIKVLRSYQEQDQDSVINQQEQNNQQDQVTAQITQEKEQPQQQQIPSNQMDFQKRPVQRKKIDEQNDLKEVKKCQCLLFQHLSLTLVSLFYLVQILQFNQFFKALFQTAFLESCIYKLYFYFQIYLILLNTLYQHLLTPLTKLSKRPTFKQFFMEILTQNIAIFLNKYQESD